MLSKKSCLKFLKRNALLVLTLLGIFIGIGIGLGIRPLKPSDDALMWLGLPGQLYLRLLKMVIVPLVVTGVITGTASLDPKANGKISVVAICFIFVKNLLGAVLGIVAYIIFKPGDEGSIEDLSKSEKPSSEMQTQDIFADLIRNIIPDNLFEATFRQTQTKYEYVTIEINTSMSTNNSVVSMVEKSVGKADGPNLLGLIFACTMIGIALASLKAKGKAVVDFCDALGQTVILMIGWILWTTPLGVISLILVAVAGIDDIGSSFRDLGMLILAVTLALVVQQLIIMPLILFILTRRNPFKHLLHIARPWLIALASSTSSGAIPEMLRSCEILLKVDKSISRFVIPFSVTVGASGSAVYISCASLFASNISGHPPSAATMFIVGCLTTVSAFAIPSVPSASIVTIVMILTSLNVPADAIVLLLAVEFLLDRLRTASCVVGHTMCSVVVQHMCEDDLAKIEDRYSEGDEEIDVVNEKELCLLHETELTSYSNGNK